MQLLRTPQLPQLKLERGLIASSFCLAARLCEAGRLGAAGSGGQSLRDRLAEFGALESERCGECTVVAATTEPARLVIELLADTGVIARSNRQALLSPSFKQFGCAVVRDPASLRCYFVLHFAERFVSDPARAVPSVIAQAEAAATFAQTSRAA